MIRAVALLVLGLVCFAQGLSLSGVVRDESGKPLAGVSVRLNTRSEGFHVTSTNPKGEYVFSGLDTAIYPVTFERDGYVTVARRLAVTFDEEDADKRARDVTMVASKGK